MQNFEIPVKDNTSDYELLISFQSAFTGNTEKVTQSTLRYVVFRRPQKTWS